jgi:26S proteasome regulatory subunit N12
MNTGVSSRAKSLINNYYQTTDTKIQQDILKQLKIMMLTFKSLPPSSEPVNQEEYLIARDILELEMERYLEKKDGKNFELSYLKIKQFYFDYKDVLTKSEKMQYFVGLYLLHLLANNRTTEFCTELELLDVSDLSNNYIKISRDLEMCIMEGNYKHIFNIKSQATNIPHYNYYLEKFDDAIKFQIARSAEKSYDSLSLNDALSLLMLNNMNELQNFIITETETIESREIDWKILNDRVYFIPINKEKTSIPSYRIIDETVSMAIEIEKII